MLKKYGVLEIEVCECEKPEIKTWNYHFIGNLIPRLMSGTSFRCKCGGIIDKEIIIPDKIRKTVENYWDNFNPDDF